MYTKTNIIKSIFFYFLDKKNDFKFIKNSLSVKIENFFQIFFIKKTKFSYLIDKNIFKAEDNSHVRFFTFKKRGFWLYREGIIARGDFLFKSYCLQNITFKKNDKVIDCGANSGDLFLKFIDLIEHENYIAIEPNPSDFELLKMNVGNKPILINKALGNKNDTMKFYVSTQNADSSLIEPLEYTEIVNVEVIRLDYLLDKLSINSVKLLKIEAEGFEPEILKGLGNKINLCEYIAVDGGYERGINSEQTFTNITNFLLANNFTLKDIYFPWCRALFKRSY